MRDYAYRVLGPAGVPVEGRIEAASYTDARARLRLVHSHIISLKEKAISTSVFRAKRVSITELTIFTRQLSLMLEAGLTLRGSLEAVGRQPVSNDLKSLIGEVIADVEAGTSFSETLARRPATFFPFYISMVKTGETAGILGRTLDRLADHMDSEMVVRRKLVSTCIYPAVMMGVAAVVLAIMTAFVLPQFENVFTELHAQLPFLTRAILGISRAAQAWWWAVLSLIAIAYFLVQRLLNRPGIEDRIQTIFWKIPFVGRILLPVEMARFCRGISLLDEGGVPVVRALKVTSETLRSPMLRSGVARAVEELEKGQSLSAAFDQTRVFPDLLIQMLSVGEKTGQLSSVLSRLATYYDQQVDILLERLSSLLEPAMILALSVIVGTVVIAMLLPIFSLSEAFGR